MGGESSYTNWAVVLGVEIRKSKKTLIRVMLQGFNYVNPLRSGILDATTNGRNHSAVIMTAESV